MKQYATISKDIRDIFIIIFWLLIAINIILCFKGMKKEKDYVELLEEKEALEEIVGVQKGMLEK